jgi:uncharacterized GH25 family protein
MTPAAPSPLKPLLPALLAAVALAALAGAAQAHRTWIVPSASVVEGAEPLVSFDAAVSEDLFEYDTNALAIDNLTIVAPDGSRLLPESRSASRRRATFDVKLPLPGTYRVSASNDNLLASYKVGEETKRWRGSADAFARDVPADAKDLEVTRLQARVETWVTRGRTGDAVPTALLAPLGAGLELIPLTPPTDLSAGDTSTFRLLLDGRPAADVDVTVLRGGNRYRYQLGEIARKTDADGSFSVRWPEAGRYWIGASHGGRGPGGSAAQPARRASFSATVEVLPQ